MTVELHLGDCLEVMRGMADKSVDAVITDPPYNIGKAEWDKVPNYIEWCGEWIGKRIMSTAPRGQKEG